MKKKKKRPEETPRFGFGFGRFGAFARFVPMVSFLVLFRVLAEGKREANK